MVGCERDKGRQKSDDKIVEQTQEGQLLRRGGGLTNNEDHMSLIEKVKQRLKVIDLPGPF